jgi:hypothetical protein
MIRPQVANLIPFFVSGEVPRRAENNDDALEIHATTQQVDSAYESFRNLLDPGDEDVLRRKAIVRIINLRWGLSNNSEKFSLALLKDLARGHYIPINTSRSGYVAKIAKVLEKNINFVKINGGIFPKWLLPMAAAEIDRVIYPREGDDALVYVFFEDMKQRVAWKDENIEEGDKDTQLFLACHRVLAKTDEAELFWHLFRTAEPAWESEPNEDELIAITGRFSRMEKDIEDALHSNIALRVLRRLHAPAVPYRILRDIVRMPEANSILVNEKLLGTSVQDTLFKRIKRTEKQMLKRVWHAAAFLFLTKGVLAVFTEIPYELFLGSIRYIPFAINMLFPPVLLFLMAGSVPRPGKENTERLVKAVQEVVDGKIPSSEILINSVESKTFRTSVFATFYGLTAIISFLFLVWILNMANFSLLGGFYFIIFLGLVSFLGLRLRTAMREYRIVAPKQKFGASLLDFITMPILDFGRELSLRASQINIFLFLLDAVIEAPFKLLLGLIEEWFSFLREKKEKLY